MRTNCLRIAQKMCTNGLKIASSCHTAASVNLEVIEIGGSITVYVLTNYHRFERWSRREFLFDGLLDHFPDALSHLEGLAHFSGHNLVRKTRCANMRRRHRDWLRLLPVKR